MMPRHDPARSSSDSVPRVAAIETLYKGYRFRSRLEARWAVFFDHLNFKWRYESQGYYVANDLYLPDFWVDGLGWVEVKGELDRAGLLKLALAAGPDGLPLDIAEGATTPDQIGRSIPGWTWLDLACPIIPRLLLLGDIPDPDRALHIQIGLSNGRHVVWHFAFFAPTQVVGLGDWYAVGADPHPSMPHGGKGLSPRIDRVSDAYRAARSARFEHGESGAI